MSSESSEPERRVWAGVPSGTRQALEDDLSGSDLQTLLLALSRRRSAAVTPAQLMRRWREDRFVRPAGVDPRRLARVEGRLWSLLPDDVAGVELSPVAPLGTCSALSPVSQNRVVSTSRLTEVVSDSTNALAVEAAHRRLRSARGDGVHLAASHRLLRAQVFSPGAAAHFRLFALVSSARDTGSARTEAQLVLRHLRFWRDAMLDLVPGADPQLHLTVWDAPAVAQRITDTVLPALGDDGRPVLVVDDPGRTRGHGYYARAALRITATGPDGEVELGDGGLTSWTAQLTADAKERCFVSCLATERLTELVGGSASTP